MLIGLGGGAASSVGSGTSSADLDFASVQRGNPEIERRAQQVIEACRALAATAGRANPILMIHDVGAGGLSNAVPELVDHAHRGGRFELRDIPSADAAMSPLEIWCNEAQERYVLAIDPADLAWFDGGVRAGALPLRGARSPRRHAAARRQRSPAGRDARGHAAGDAARQAAADGPAGDSPAGARHRTWTCPGSNCADACLRVLRLPAVADKSFLIHIGDRTVGGLVARDQLVGPWQVPVSDVGVTALGFDDVRRRSDGDGRALARGAARRAGLRPARGGRGADQRRGGLDPPRLGRAAVGQLDGGGRRARRGRAPLRHRGCRERPVPRTRDRHSGGQGLPVHADALAGGRGDPRRGGAGVAGGLGLRAGGRRAPHADAASCGASRTRRSGSSISARAATGWAAPAWPRPSCAPAASRRTWTTPAALGSFFAAIQELRAAGPASWPITTAATAACSSPCARWPLPVAPASTCSSSRARAEQQLGALFAEELGGGHPGAGRRCRQGDGRAGRGTASSRRLRRVARVTTADEVAISAGGAPLFASSRTDLLRAWSELSYRMQALRDNPAAAAEAWQCAARPGRSRPLAAPDLRSGGGPGGPVVAAAGAGPAWRSSASRASTASWRWPPPSGARASTRWTCT